MKTFQRFCEDTEDWSATEFQVRDSTVTFTNVPLVDGNFVDGVVEFEPDEYVQRRSGSRQANFHRLFAKSARTTAFSDNEGNSIPPPVSIQQAEQSLEDAFERYQGDIKRDIEADYDPEPDYNNDARYGIDPPYGI